MDTISEYIDYLEEYRNAHPNMSEDLFVRFVYLDLASKFSFDVNFLPFGNSKKRQEIYKRGLTGVGLEECFKKKVAICNSLSRILEHILKHFNIQIRTIIDPIDIRKCPHVFNEIYSKEKNKKYWVDLQEDMYRIQMRGFTINYGINPDGGPRVFSRDELTKFDNELGYISSQEYYTDEYIYNLKSLSSMIDDIFEKLEFILDNIEIIDNKDLSHIDRQWYHSKILEQLFTKKEFDYQSNKGLIRFLDCYKKTDDKVIYYNVICIKYNDELRVYFYDKNAFKYKRIQLENFANAIANGLTIHKCEYKQIEKLVRSRKTN